MANTLTLRIGQTVKTHDGREGVIRFIGTGSFATGEWIGLELPENKGKNDGSVKGHRYFQCTPGHGLFLRRNTIKTVTKQPRLSFTKPVSRSRQSSTSSGSSNAKTRAPPSPKGGKPLDKSGAPPASKKGTTPEKQEHDMISEVEGLRRDNDRYKNHIIPILEEKLKSSKKEISELRKQNTELEATAASEDAPIAAITADLEMATIDKEMAEQRAENLAAELEEVKFKNEELVTDLELLKEETFQLAATALPDERASLSQQKFENERQVMHDAVAKFRELTKENDIELKSQIQELQTELVHTTKFKVKYESMQEKLAKAEASNQYLREQLDATETQEEVMLRLERQKYEEHVKYEQLDKQYQELVEVAQINNELETVHMKDRYELFSEVERTHTLLDERERTIAEQDRTIQDLQYVLVKFRNTVHTLQHKANKSAHNPTEAKSSEINGNDRAALDLNLTLASQAADRMKRDIDHKMMDNALVEANDKVEIMGHFVVNGYDDELKFPITLMHRMRKVKEESSLVLNFFRIRVRMLFQMTCEEQLDALEVTEYMCRIAVACERFDNYLLSCDVAAFSQMTAISADLASVEKAMDEWVYLCRENNMGKAKSEDLQRMPGVLEDLAEKFINKSVASHNIELIALTATTENYLYSCVGQLETMRTAVQMSRLSQSCKEEFEHFESRLEIELLTKTQRARFMAEQLVRGLKEMQERSIGISEQAWDAFADLDSSSKLLSHLIRAVTRALVEITNEVKGASLTFAVVLEVMTNTAKEFLQAHPIAGDEQADDVFSIIASKLQWFHERIANTQAKARDLSFVVDIGKSPHPWLVRAKEFKAQEVISAEMRKELTSLRARFKEQEIQLLNGLSRHTELEVMVEHLKSRSKDAEGNKAAVQQLRTEMDRKTEENAMQGLHVGELERALEALEGRYEKLKVEAAKGLGGGSSGVALESANDVKAQGTKAEQTQLRSELEATQASVRQIRLEAYWAGLPWSDVQLAGEKQSWLHPSELRFTDVQNHDVSYKNETQSLFKELLSLADKLPATALQRPPAPEEANKGKRATGRLPVMKQKGQVARWGERKGGLVGRVPWRH